VAHGRLGGGVPQFAAHGAAGERLESRRRHELARAGGHDDLHLGAAFPQTPHEVCTLIGCDTAGNPEQDPLAVHTPIISLFDDPRMI
jgi:hypothetical protein